MIEYCNNYHLTEPCNVLDICIYILEHNPQVIYRLGAFLTYQVGLKQAPPVRRCSGDQMLKIAKDLMFLD